MSVQVPKGFTQRMGEILRYVLSCCDKNENEDEDDRPAIKIGHPTGFIRHNVSFPSLSPQQQAFIQGQAKSDAERMWNSLQPLKSSPSGTFAQRPDAYTPTHEEFTTPRAAPRIPTSPPPSSSPLTASRLDRFVAHSRKISDTLRGYQSVGRGEHGVATPCEMRALMDGQGESKAGVVTPLGKSSGESFSVTGSEEEREMGRAMAKF